MYVHALQEPLQPLPVHLIVVAGVYLGDIGEHVVLGIVEDERRVFCFLSLKSIVEHVGRTHQHAPLGRRCHNELNPVLPPCRWGGRLVVHAVQDMPVLEAVGQHPGHECFLVRANEIEPLIILRHACDRVKEGLEIPGRMLWVFGGKAGLFAGVVHVVAGIPRAGLPVFLRIIKAVPDLDLHEDVPFGRPPQHALKARPVLLVPLVQVEAAVRQQPVRLELRPFALAHRIAHVVGSNLLDLVEMLLKPLQQEDVIGHAAAEQHDRLALVLPVPRVVGVWLNAILVSHRHLLQGDLGSVRSSSPRSMRRAPHTEKIVGWGGQDDFNRDWETSQLPQRSAMTSSSDRRMVLSNAPSDPLQSSSSHRGPRRCRSHSPKSSSIRSRTSLKLPPARRTTPCLSTRKAHGTPLMFP